MSDLSKATFDQVIAYLSVAIILLGLVGNTACFLIFRFDKKMRQMSSNVYLCYCSITDTISLFVWNFNHFLDPLFDIIIEEASLFTCRTFSFIQYVSLQSSAWLLSVMCMDRFFSVISIPGSFSSRLPFSTTKSAHIWSILIMTMFFFANIHVLISNGYVSPPKYVNETSITSRKVNNGSVHLNQTKLILRKKLSVECYSYSPTESFAAFWEPIHLYIYSFVPFFFMLAFNILLVIRILKRNKISNLSTKSHHESNHKMSENGKTKMTVSILVITISFIIMTLPSSIAFGYFYVGLDFGSLKYSFFKFLDFFGFLNRASLFFNCFLSNLKFRLIVLRVVSRGRIISETKTTRTVL